MYGRNWFQVNGTLLFVCSKKARSFSEGERTPAENDRSAGLVVVIFAKSCCILATLVMAKNLWLLSQERDRNRVVLFRVKVKKNSEYLRKPKKS